MGLFVQQDSDIVGCRKVVQRPPIETRLTPCGFLLTFLLFVLQGTPCCGLSLLAVAGFICARRSEAFNRSGVSVGYSSSSMAPTGIQYLFNSVLFPRRIQLVTKCQAYFDPRARYAIGIVLGVDVENERVYVLSLSTCLAQRGARASRPTGVCCLKR